MKNIKLKFRNYLESIDKRWQLLTLEKQHQYLLTFLLGYGLTSGCVFIKIGYDVLNTSEKLQIEHIKHPIQKSKEIEIEIEVQKDTLTTILKNDWYEG